MKEITYAQAINDAISEEMRRDSDVFMMGEDIAVYCGAYGVSLAWCRIGKPEMATQSPTAYVGAAMGRPAGRRQL